MERTFVAILAVLGVVSAGFQACLAWFRPDEWRARELRAIDAQQYMPRFLFLFDADTRRNIVRSALWIWYVRIGLTAGVLFFFLVLVKALT